ncbi:MAG: DUF3754 domain-containing protein [Proteobacteria bacterium]|nr:DUF3754 domain-containing protein [Pseudomonadota bacterium]
MSQIDRSELVHSLVAEIFANPEGREKFIPVTRQALLDRLSAPAAWPNGVDKAVRRFFVYLSQWRQQGYGARLLELERIYEPFSPDSDLLVTRQFTYEERLSLRGQLTARVCDLLRQANYTRLDPTQVDLIMTRDSAYGLDLHVDLNAFDHLEIWYRGTDVEEKERRSLRKLYLRKEKFDVPIFRRFAILFKLKSEEKRINELMESEGLPRARAEKRVKKMRGLVPNLKSDLVYLKLFKNIPRADLEMVFPNTEIRFKLFDKIKLGVTASGGLGVGVAGTVSKLAVASNPITLAGAVFGLGGVAARQLVNFVNQRNKYMVVMAQNLYSHALADNRGVMSSLAEAAAEQDVKEEILLYSLLAKERVKISELKQADEAIERYLSKSFGLDVDFEVDDALSRLLKDGIVKEGADGYFETLPPDKAALRIDELWERYLDDLPDLQKAEGREFEGGEAQQIT